MFIIYQLYLNRAVFFFKMESIDLGGILQILIKCCLFAKHSIGTENTKLRNTFPVLEEKSFNEENICFHYSERFSQELQELKRKLVHFWSCRDRRRSKKESECNAQRTFKKQLQNEGIRNKYPRKQKSTKSIKW